MKASSQSGTWFLRENVTNKQINFSSIYIGRNKFFSFLLQKKKEQKKALQVEDIKELQVKMSHGSKKKHSIIRLLLTQSTSC